MEKVIKEVRIIETDDGFRIEVKGDKGAFRKWFEHSGHCGPMHHGRRMRHHGPWGHPWGAGMWGKDFGSCCAPSEEPEEEKDE